MKLSEVFSQLAYGELSQLGLIDSDTGLIAAGKKPQVVSNITLGLTALYKRFNLKEGSVVVPLVTNQVLYTLTPTDILKVEKVLTDDEYELGLNDGSSVYSCSTPSAGVLRLPSCMVMDGEDAPEDLITDNVTVVYRANHPVLALASADTVDLELPYSHLEALVLYVASRMHNPIGMTNEFHAGNSYAAKYEKACLELEVKDLQIDTMFQNTGISRGGWV